MELKELIVYILAFMGWFWICYMCFVALIHDGSYTFSFIYYNNELYWEFPIFIGYLIFIIYAFIKKVRKGG